MTQKREVTLYDIARQLSLSSATGNRAFQGRPGIGKKTKKRIFKFAGQTGYQINPIASNFKDRKTRIIGVLVHDLNSDFIAAVLAGVEKIAALEGYNIIIAQSSESFEKVAKNIYKLFNKGVEGLISSLCPGTNNPAHFNPVLKNSVPIVFFDRVEGGQDKTVVIIDNEKCGYTATRHLIEQGCKKIIHVTSALNLNVYADRFRGCRNALLENGLVFDDSMLIVGDLSENSGIDAATKILTMRPLPDGLFIANDLTAAFCMLTLKENGVSIPEDIAVVGFNNDAIGQLLNPALTTIDYPGGEIGKRAATALINHLKGGSILEQARTIIVQSGLIIRQSSLKKASK